MHGVHLSFSHLLTNDFLVDASASLEASRKLIGLWLILSTAQWLVAADVFSDEGPLPWAELGRLRMRPWIGKLRRRMSTPALRAVLAMQLVVATVLLATTSVPLLVGCLAWLIASYGGFVLLTGEYWTDGSDKMGMIAMSGTLVTGTGALLGDPALALAGVLIAGGQLTVCYMVAGVSKTFFADWRSGAELAAIMATEAAGTPFAARLVRIRPVALAATWGVILGEALFPLALLMPHGWLLAALGAALLFHVATAICMRLNMFPWAFVATYPAVLLFGRIVRAALGWDG